MKLYEHQGKSLFSAYGIPVPRGRTARSEEEAAAVAAELGSPTVLKPQVLQGRRGKAGMIRFASSADEARAFARELFHGTLGGVAIEEVLVEERLNIDSELYLSLSVDAGARVPVLLASASGGVDVEEVPPERLVRVPIPPDKGAYPYLGRQVAKKLGLTGGAARQFAELVGRLYRLFRERDCELVEINPLVLSGENLVAADAKVIVDDDALYRQEDLPRQYDLTDLERRARERGLQFVQLNGDIAVMANGAGITMATIDVLESLGGRPANFLDVGGGTGEEKTALALEFLLETRPRVVFVNIFGGITRCDDVARAFLKVYREREFPCPFVIRLTGTNEEEALALLQREGVAAYRDMLPAARRAVEMAAAEGGAGSGDHR